MSVRFGECLEDVQTENPGVAWIRDGMIIVLIWYCRSWFAGVSALLK
jgi:hypothetical protein